MPSISYTDIACLLLRAPPHSSVLTVIATREPLIHDRIEYFGERFLFHRHTMEFGRDLEETFVVKDLFSDTFPGKVGA